MYAINMDELNEVSCFLFTLTEVAPLLEDILGGYTKTDDLSQGQFDKISWLLDKAEAASEAASGIAQCAEDAHAMGVTAEIEYA